MAESPLDLPIFIGGTASEGSAALAYLLSEHPELQACVPVRFGVISENNGVVDALRMGQVMQKADKIPWWDRIFAEKQPAFHPEPMMGEERTPPEELVELLHRRFLPDALLKPVGHRADELTSAEIEAAAERYLATFWEQPKLASVNLVHDLLRPTHGRTETEPARRWIDASRTGAVRAPYLIDLFPDAKFIHLIREGRNVALRLMEIATGSSFPGAPESSIPIDEGKEWNQAAFNRALALWERRVISAASGLQQVPESSGMTVRLADLMGEGGPEVVDGILDFIDATPTPIVREALRQYISPEILRQDRADEVIPPDHLVECEERYAASLARLTDLGIPTP